ncbi:hypothetical protein ACIQ7D_06740 [Streptomyces sp. NPDC096310]
MNRPARDAWARTGRRLLVEAVEELAYEDLSVPVREGAPGYRPADS